MTEWPPWWEWEIDLSPHVFKRMLDRQFTEVELRSMLTRALALRPDVVDGRWVVEARHARRRWEVIVEPDFDAKLLVVVTAYAVWDS